LEGHRYFNPLAVCGNPTTFINRVTIIVETAIGPNTQRSSEKMAILNSGAKSNDKDIEEITLFSSSFLNQALDSLQAHVAVLDHNGFIKLVNKTWRDFANANRLQTADYCVGANYIEFCEQIQGEEAKDGQATADGIRLVISGELENFYLRYNCDSPTQRRWFQARISPITTETENCVIIVHENITELSLTMHALQNSEKKFRATLEHAPTAMLLADSGGNILQVNRAAGKLTGYDEDDLLGSNLADYIHGKGLKSAMLLQRKLFAGKTPSYTTTQRYHHKQGHTIDVELSASLVGNGGGQPLYSIIQGHDISVRLQHEAELTRYQQIISSTQELMAIVDTDYRYVAINDNYQVHFNRSREQIIGHTVIDLHGEARFQTLLKPNIDRCFLGEKVNTQAWIDFPEKGRRYIDSWYTPLSENNRITGAVVSVRDITERKLVEENFLDLLENAPDAMVFVDSAGQIKRVNSKTEELFGYRRSELIGESIEILVPQRYHQAHVRHRAEYFESPGSRPMGQTMQEFLFGRKRNGEEFPVEISLNTLETQEGILVSSSIRDVSERVAVQRSLRELASELLRIEETEKRRVATYLHDNLAQTLATIKIRAGEIRKMLGSDKQVKVFDDFNRNLNEAIADIRNMTFELGCPVLYELGIEAALEDLALRFKSEHGIHCNFSSHGKIEYMSDEERSMIYQSIRELLNNVVKHAQSSRVDLSIEQTETGIEAIVADDGKGFKIPEDGFHATSREGYGLFNILQRITNFGGNMKITSRPGDGARVVITMPMDRENNRQSS